MYYHIIIYEYLSEDKKKKCIRKENSDYFLFYKTQYAFY